MSGKYSFKGYYIRYDCPICGRPKSPPDIDGQSILWIADECIRAGAALSPCYSCGKTFSIPASVFADGVLAEFKRVSELPGDQLFGYVNKKYVKKRIQPKLLKPNWYDIVLEANKSGPVDTMNLAWEPYQPCPNCGSGPYSQPISFTYACPFCGCVNTVSQQSIDPSLGVRVSCRACFTPLIIPPQVWCPRCKRALVDYYQVIRYIADCNGVNAEKLLPPME